MCILPGDPKRAEFIATKLENVKQVTNVRGMLGFTGSYKVEISKMYSSLISIMLLGKVNICYGSRDGNTKLSNICAWIN